MVQKYINLSKRFRNQIIPLCLGKIAKDFTFDNMEKKLIKWIYIYLFVDVNTTDASGIVDIYENLMKKIVCNNVSIN